MPGSCPYCSIRASKSSPRSQLLLHLVHGGLDGGIGRFLRILQLAFQIGDLRGAASTVLAQGRAVLGRRFVISGGILAPDQPERFRRC